MDSVRFTRAPHCPRNQAKAAACRRIRSFFLFWLLMPAQTMLAAEAGNELPPDDEPLTIIITSPHWQPVDIQQLPAAIETVSGEELRVSGSKDSIDLQQRVPGLLYRTNSVLGLPFLRGVGTEIISPGADASVATYIDGIYQSRAAASIQELYDLRRVEVVKGPQGIHMGRNVTGGAVSLLYNDPQPYYQANLGLTYGDYQHRRLEGVINLPLDESDWSMRLAGVVSMRDGYSRNLYLNNTLDDADNRSGRIKLRYHPSDNLDVILSAEQRSQDDTRSLGQHVDTRYGVNGGVANGGTVPSNPREVLHNQPEWQHATYNQYYLKVVLGGERYKVLSTTVMQETDADVSIDLDGTEIDFSHTLPVESSRAFSQEIRVFTDRLQPLSWTAGIYLLREEARQALEVRLPLYAVRNLPDGRVDTWSHALFGEVSQRFGEHWRGTAGLRYTHDKRAIDMVHTLEDPLGVFGPPGTTVQTQQDSDDWEALTPELSLEYHPNDATQYFLKLGRGFKSGGFNTAEIQPAFDPEFLNAIELGWKQRLSPWQTRLQGSVFRYELSDMQLLTVSTSAPPGTFPTVANAAGATINGVELGLVAHPTADLSLSASLALLDAKFDRFVSVDPNNPGVDPDRSGNTLPQAPDVSAMLGADYHWRLDTSHLALGLRLRYQSDVNFGPYEDPAMQQDSYTLLGAHLTLVDQKDTWTLSIFGNNLTDVTYAQTITRQDPVSGTSQLLGAPRTWGISAELRF